MGPFYNIPIGKQVSATSVSESLLLIGCVDGSLYLCKLGYPRSAVVTAVESFSSLGKRPLANFLLPALYLAYTLYLEDLMNEPETLLMPVYKFQNSVTVVLLMGSHHFYASDEAGYSILCLEDISCIIENSHIILNCFRISFPYGFGIPTVASFMGKIDANPEFLRKAFGNRSSATAGGILVIGSSSGTTIHPPLCLYISHYWCR